MRLHRPLIACPVKQITCAAANTATATTTTTTTATTATTAITTTIATATATATTGSLTPLPHYPTTPVPHYPTTPPPRYLTTSLSHYLTISLPHYPTTSLPHYLTTPLPDYNCRFHQHNVAWGSWEPCRGGYARDGGLRSCLGPTRKYHGRPLGLCRSADSSSHMGSTQEHRSVA